MVRLGSLCRRAQHHLGHQHGVGIERLPRLRPASIGQQLPGNAMAAMELPPGQQLLAQLWDHVIERLPNRSPVQLGSTLPGKAQSRAH